MAEGLIAVDSLYAGAIIVHVDFDSSTVIVWNGSETFRVVLIDDDGMWHDVDAFTRYDDRLDAGESLQSTVHAARMIADEWWKARIAEEQAEA